MKKFKSFEDAREFIQSLKLKNVRELESFRKSKQIPKDIPSSPKQIYKKEWKGWGDFLGTGVIQTQKRQYKTFEDVKKYVHSLNLKNREEWITWNKSNQISNDVPIAPQKVYKKEWEGWGDFLGTGVIQTQKRQYKTFEDAKSFTRNLNLKNISEWREYAHSNKRPKDIPSLPHKTYKNKGWISVGDWLGTNSIASFNRKYRSFNEARKFIQSLKLKNYEEWAKYCKSGKKPEDIPSAPWTVYKEWKNEKEI